MPRENSQSITFFVSKAEHLLLEEYCKLSQRSKTEVMRELIRGLKGRKLRRTFSDKR